MFWKKASPTTVPHVATTHTVDINPSSLEKGGRSDRRSSFSSTDSSINTPNAKQYLDLPASPERAHTSTRTSSIHEPENHISSVGTRSFPVYSSNDESSRYQSTTRRPPGFIRRHWFVITLIVLATIGIGAALIATLVSRNKNSPNEASFAPNFDGGVSTDTPIVRSSTLLSEVVTSLPIETETEDATPGISMAPI